MAARKPNVVVALLSLPFLFALAYYAFVVYTMQKLQQAKCSCAHTWQPGFIRGYAIAMLAFVIISALAAAAYPALLRNPAFAALAMLVSLVGIVNLIVSAMFIVDMKREQCNCADSLSLDVWSGFIILQLAMFLLSIIGALFR